MTKMTLSCHPVVICKTKWQSDHTPSGLHFEKTYKPDGVPSNCHFILQMITGCNPILFAFWKKCKPDGVSSGCQPNATPSFLHLKKKVNRMGCHPIVKLPNRPKSLFAVDSHPINKLTIIINNITHKLLININNCLSRTYLKL